MFVHIAVIEVVSGIKVFTNNTKEIFPVIT